MTPASAWQTGWYLLALVGTAASAWTDGKHRVIPNRLIVSWGIVAGGGSVVQRMAFETTWHGMPHVLGFAVIGGALSLAFALRYVGGGDAKMAMVWGWCLGWPAAVVAIWLTTLVSLPLFAWAIWHHRHTGQAWQRVSIPWAVALCLGTLAYGVLTR